MATTSDMSKSLKQEASHKSFGGFQKVYSHYSNETKCVMRFGVYFPPKAQREKVPVLYYLSGLTSTEDNFITKSGVQRYASELGLAIVNPDTSPRGCGIPGEDASPDVGTGASFYVDATEAPWRHHYRMHSYVTRELPALLAAAADTRLDHTRVAIFGHSRMIVQS